MFCESLQFDINRWLSPVLRLQERQYGFESWTSVITGIYNMDWINSLQLIVYKSYPLKHKKIFARCEVFSSQRIIADWMIDFL